MHYIFNGPGTVAKMNNITSNLKKVIIISSQTYKNAMAGRRACLSENIICYVQDFAETKEVLFINKNDIYKAIVTV